MVNAPPCDHTITGRRSEADAASVHTLRYKQSSLIGVAVDVAPPRPPAPPLGCMHRAPNWSAERTPAQLRTGCGGRHRNGPTGGAANGMPLNTRMLAVLPAIPDTSPASMRTGAGRVATPDSPARTMAVTTRVENHVESFIWSAILR